MEAGDAAPVTEKIATENAKLKEDLKEHRDVIHYLRGKLQEVNMLNGKLMYTNKLFRGFDLSGKQKITVIETFDRATNLREVKLLYATLAENLTGKRVNGKKSNVSALTEGLASKVSASTKPKTAVLNETKEQVTDAATRARLQKIAGIRPFNG
jgi:hypothetical protein